MSAVRLSVVRQHAPYRKILMSLLVAGLSFGPCTSCDRRPVEQVEPAEAPSVLDSHPHRSDDDVAEVVGHLDALIAKTLGGEADDGDLVEEMRLQSQEALWHVLSRMPGTEGAEGEKGGLAMVILSVLASKAPADCVSYLTSRQSAFGLYKTDGGLLAFRQAMEEWSKHSAESAFARLAKLQEDDRMQQLVEQIASTHGESLELSMTGSMPIDDPMALHRQWSALTHKEVGAVLSRHLDKVKTPNERSDLIQYSADWVSQEWREKGPQAVFDWVMGLTDEGLRDEVLDRVKSPKQGRDRP